MISVVVAVFNEEKIVLELVKRLENVLNSLGKDYEAIFVDDGSKDKTAELIEAAHARNSRLKLIQFSRNFGQVPAIRAGLKHAKGDIVVVMDGDLQDLPEEIPRLISKLDEGYDIVYGEREGRKHSSFRNLSSRIFAWILRKCMTSHVLPVGTETMLFGVFRAMRREAVDVFNGLSERSGYFQGLANFVGFCHVIVPVEHGARFAGKSHYTLRKLIRYGLGAIAFLNPYPLRLAIPLGGIIALLSLVVGIWQIIIYVTVGALHITILLLSAIFFWGGVQVSLVGILGEYIGGIYLESKQRPLFIIKKKLL